MKLWIDDVRSAPNKEWVWLRSVNDAIHCILECQYLYNASRPPYNEFWKIEIIDIDHDAGDYAIYGGDYIKLLDWLEETGRNYPIHIHSMNPIGVENMRRIIQKNGWREIK